LAEDLLASQEGLCCSSVSQLLKCTKYEDKGKCNVSDTQLKGGDVMFQVAWRAKKIPTSARNQGPIVQDVASNTTD
jgi:hypothetical protein